MPAPRVEKALRVTLSFVPIALLMTASPAEAVATLPQEAPPPPAAVAKKTGSEILVEGKAGAPKTDPLKGVNTLSYDAIQVADDAVVRPVAMAYKAAVPSPARKGIRNFLYNLHEPVVFVNYLLQLKPGKAVETLGRFSINSTIGVGGLIDVAKRKGLNMPRRTNGFAYTLGYYGVKPGAFLYLPLIGATSVRDVTGRVLDLTLVPSTIGGLFGRPEFSLTTGTLRSLDDRVESDARFKSYEESDGDPYEALRIDYMTRRQAEIDALRGKPTAPPAAPAPEGGKRD